MRKMRWISGEPHFEGTSTIKDKGVSNLQATNASNKSKAGAAVKNLTPKAPQLQRKINLPHMFLTLGRKAKSGECYHFTSESNHVVKEDDADEDEDGVGFSIDADDANTTVIRDDGKMVSCKQSLVVYILLFAVALEEAAMASSSIVIKANKKQYYLIPASNNGMVKAFRGSIKSWNQSEAQFNIMASSSRQHLVSNSTMEGNKNIDIT